MFQLRIPSRPVRYAIVAAHTFREALEDISVDSLSTIVDSKLEALADKVAELEAKLEALDESIDETPRDQAETKTKAKRKPRAKSKK